MFDILWQKLFYLSQSEATEYGEDCRQAVAAIFRMRQTSNHRTLLIDFKNTLPGQKKKNDNLDLNKQMLKSS